MKRITVPLFLFPLFFIGGCTAKPEPTTNSPTATPTQQLVGNDKDVHGCIGSAGYSWCETKQKCLRLWEEPCTKTK